MTITGYHEDEVGWERERGIAVSFKDQVCYQEGIDFRDLLQHVAVRNAAHLLLNSFGNHLLLKFVGHNEDTMPYDSPFISVCAHIHYYSKYIAEENVNEKFFLLKNY